MSEVKRIEIELGLDSDGIYVLAADYDAVVKELETARRVREKLTEQRDYEITDASLGLEFGEKAIARYDAEIAAIERGEK